MELTFWCFIVLDSSSEWSIAMGKNSEMKELKANIVNAVQEGISRMSEGERQAFIGRMEKAAGILGMSVNDPNTYLAIWMIGLKMSLDDADEMDEFVNLVDIGFPTL